MGKLARRWRVAISGLVTAAAFTVGFASLLAAAGRPAELPAAARWLATPGTRVIVDDSGRAIATVSSTVVPVGGAVRGVPVPELATTLLTALTASGIDPAAAVVERSFTVIPTGDGGVSAGLALAVADEEAIWEALSWDTQGGVIAYLPLREQLPADPARTRSWSSEGLTNGISPFSVSGRVDSLNGDCATVTTRSEQAIAGGVPLVTDLRTRWCAGAGQVSAEDLRSASTVSVTVDFPAGPLPSPPPGGISPTAPLPGVDLGAITALAGLTVGVDRGTGDLLAWTAAPEPVLRWWHHPGGVITALGAGDGLIVVGTSQRAVLAFDALGQLRWTAAQPDVAVGRIDIAGGRVNVPLATGSTVTLVAESGALMPRLGVGRRDG